MHLDLRLKEMPVPRIGAIQLVSTVRELQEIARRNYANDTGDTSSQVRENRKEEMKLRLMERGKGITFEQATDEDGRASLLLSLYIQYFALPDTSWWLPAFDKSIASSVLGDDGREWNGRLRKQAALLFFTHFEKLPALDILCCRLLESFLESDALPSSAASVWHQKPDTIFAMDGAQKVANAAKKGETLTELMARFTLREKWTFSDRLKESFLLNRLESVELGQGREILEELEANRTLLYQGGVPLGAAALRIMVQRVANEGGRRWSGDWPSWIVKLGCDPRHGRATAEGAKWWGWATDDELRLAQQGITGLTLRFFVEFLRQSLEGETGETQFKRRAKFLMGLEAAQKINDARIVVSEPIYQRLQHTFRNSSSVARFQDGGQEAKAIICLSCADDVFVIEGTHNFGLRAFHRQFPLSDFWNVPRRIYVRSQLVVPQAQCPIFLTHGQHGGWISDFFSNLRSRFHVEWDDVRI